ncbi:hypothetical protein [Komarekiella delphini-convector]|nr:hypothetical protein [Komarekiella delphini-convector]
MIQTIADKPYVYVWQLKELVLTTPIEGEYLMKLKCYDLQQIAGE